jgi:hypothetical protein
MLVISYIVLAFHKRSRRFFNSLVILHVNSLISQLCISRIETRDEHREILESKLQYETKDKEECKSRSECKLVTYYDKFIEM